MPQRVNESKKASGTEWAFLLAMSVLIIYGAFTSEFASTKYWLGIPWTIGIAWLLIQRKTLAFTVDCETILIEKSGGLLNRIEKKHFSTNEIIHIKIWQLPIKSKTIFRIDFLLKDKTEVIMPFLDIDKRAEIVELLKQELLAKPIKLVYGITVDDKAFLILNEIILTKYNLSPKRVHPYVYFNGKQFEEQPVFNHRFP